MKKILFFLTVLLSVDIWAGPAAFDLGVEAYGKKNYEDAFRYFTEASNDGNTTACLYLGSMYFSGLYVKPDLDKAKVLFRRAAEKNDHLAQLALSQLLYMDGVRNKDSIVEGNKWLIKAAEGGNSEAQFNLAQRLSSGQNIDKDAEKSIFWLKEAAKNDQPQAKVILGVLCLEGKYVRQDRKQGFILLEEEARKRNTDALVLLGLYSVSGRHVKKNVPAGFRLIDSAAKQNYSVALYWKGLLLYAGLGCVQNKKKGEENIKAAAKAGFKDAEVFLKNLEQYEKSDNQTCITQVETLIADFFARYLR